MFSSVLLVIRRVKRIIRVGIKLIALIKPLNLILATYFKLTN